MIGFLAKSTQVKPVHSSDLAIDEVEAVLKTFPLRDHFWSMLWMWSSVSYELNTVQRENMQTPRQRMLGITLVKFLLIKYWFSEDKDLIR